MKKPDSSARSGRSRERSSNSYDRSPGKRKPGECILIVCEGKETEPNYFRELRNELRLPTIQVEIQKGAGVPARLVEEAQRLEKLRKQDPSNDNFEAIWCVLDVENPDCNPTFEPAIQKAKNSHYFLAVSNPSFEFWYILHFDGTTRPFANGEEVKRYLRNHWIPGYDEAKPVFGLLKDNLIDAIQRSKQIWEKYPEPSAGFPNPSTQVHLLVEKMLAMSPDWNKKI